MGNGKFEMGIQFPSAEYPSDDASAFLESMIKLEDHIKRNAMIYSKEWFGKIHKSEEVINALWTPMLKYSKDRQLVSLIRLKHQFFVLRFLYGRVFGGLKFMMKKVCLYFLIQTSLNLHL